MARCTPTVGCHLELPILAQISSSLDAGAPQLPPSGLSDIDQARAEIRPVRRSCRLQRTFAIWIQRTGATVKDVQGAMRHALPDQTLKVYMRKIPDGVRNAVEALDQITITMVGERMAAASAISVRAARREESSCRRLALDRRIAPHSVSNAIRYRKKSGGQSRP